MLLNVLMSKMVTDWFADKEISFSLAIFVNSWPIGIAIALIVLPVLAEASGLTAALSLVAVLTMVGFAGPALFYRSPSGAGVEQIAAGDRVRGAILGAVVAAGAIWGLYNMALAIVFSFGPELFIGKGMGLVEAGSVTSIILWMLAIFGSLAGFLIDWTGRRYLILVIGNLGFALFVIIGSWTNQVLVNVIAMGLFSGMAVGAMMSLPALVLTPTTRAVGMGIFFHRFLLLHGHRPDVRGLDGGPNGRRRSDVPSCRGTVDRFGFGPANLSPAGPTNAGREALTREAIEAFFANLDLCLEMAQTGRSPGSP